MWPSTSTEHQKINRIIVNTRTKIEELLQAGKKVHIIWDFDGVLASSRSDDIFALTHFDLAQYFAYEERLLCESPEPGSWLLPIAHNAGSKPRFPTSRFTQDIVTARSSFLAMRVHMFCLSWNLPMRWMLFLGHQPKQESYRIILRSLKHDASYHVFCIDDSAKHVDIFQDIAKEEGMDNRAHGIVSPVIRQYSKKELKKHFERVMSATGGVPLRVRDPSDDTKGFIVLPGGITQFKKQINKLVDEQNNQGHHFELRNAFVEAYGEVGGGRFKTEEELERAMNEFIVGIHCP